MGNRFLGEISVEHDGTTYTARFDFNAMCDFEDMAGRNAMEAIAEFEEGTIGFNEMRSLMLAALKQEHAEADARLAGAILSADMDVLARLIHAAFPTADPASETAPGNRKAGKRAA